MNVAKKSFILKALKKGPIVVDSSHPNYLADVRVLASGLLSIMMTAPAGSSRQQVSDASSSSEKSVVGKHVIVTLGDQGLLWVGSNGAAMGWDGKARADANADVVELDDNTFAR
jgi:hypothetical protein